MKEKYVGTFNGKMDKDTDKSLVSAEDYIYALNFSNNDKEVSSSGVGGKIRSNELITNSYSDEGDEVIGRATYEKGDGEIFFVKNSNPLNNKILYLRYKDESIYRETGVKLLATGAWLNFSNDIEAKCYDDFVFFTDNDNEPRLLNIEKAINYNIQTEYTNKILYYFDELQGRYYDGFDDEYDYFIYDNEVYKVIVPFGSSFTVVIPTDPLQSEYTKISDFNDDTYYYLRNSDVTLIALPPLTAPTTSYLYDDTRKINNVYGNLFAITYRYIYADGRESVWSPFSNLSFPLGDTTEDGYMVETASNAISIRINGNSKRNLKGIDIAVKNLSNELDFRIIETVRIEDNPTALVLGYTFNFFNDESYTNLSLSESLRQQDYIPPRVENLNILHDGRLLLGNMEMNDDKLVSDVNLELETKTTDVDPQASIPLITQTLSHNGVSFTHYEVNSSKGFQEGMRCFVDFSYSVNGGSSNDTTVNFAADYYEEENTNSAKMLRFIRELMYNIRKGVFDSYNFRDTGLKALDTDFNIDSSDKEEAYFEIGNGRDNAVLASSTLDAKKIGLTSGDIDSFKFIVLDNDLEMLVRSPVGVETQITLNITINSIEFTESNDIEIPTVRSNSTSVIGLRYYDDAGRQSSVIKCGDINTDYLNQGTLGGTNYDIISNKIKATVNHLPPSWATKYSFMAMKNRSYTSYLQIIVKSYDSSGTYSKFKLNSAITEMAEDNDNLQISSYVFTEGDRIRKIATGVSTTEYTYIDGFDVEILKQDDEYIYFKNVTTNLASGDIVEVYSPKKLLEDDDSDLYYEVDEVRSISTDGYHIGNEQTQTSSLPAIIELSYADAFIRKRVTFGTVSNFIYFIEDASFCDYYASTFNGYGRLGIVSDVKEDQSTTIRFGGKILPESDSNYVAEFNYDDYDNLSDAYGPIYGIETVGNTVVVFQKNKVTSFYVNRTSIQEDDGATQTILSNEVLNNKSVSEFDFGCINSESIIKRDTHVLFFDAINGNFVRHSKNGMVDISAYGISELSNIMGDAVRNNVLKLQGGYNERNGLFYWLIKFTPIDIPEFMPPEEQAVIEAKNAYWSSAFEYDNERLAIVFDNKNNAWKTFVQFSDGTDNVDMIGSTGSYLTSYIGSTPYIFDTLDFGNIFGRDVETHVEKVINTQPTKTKIFNNLEVNSDDSWRPYEVGDVKTATQESRIRLMKEKEGHFYSDIKRNCLYPNGTSRPNENSGDVMRGNWCSVKLRLPSDEDKNQSTITNISAEVTLSEKI